MDDAIVEEIGKAIIDTLKRHGMYLDHVAGDLIRSVLAVVEPAQSGIDVAKMLKRARQPIS